MARAAYITTDVWMDDGFHELCNDAKLLWFYLMSAPFSNIAGFYKLPLSYVEVDVNKESANILQSPCKMWKYDADTKQVLLPNFLKYNTPKSTSQMKAVAKQVQNLGRCPLMVDFFYNAYKYCPKELFGCFDDRFKDYIKVEAKARNDKESLVVLNIFK